MQISFHSVDIDGFLFSLASLSGEAKHDRCRVIFAKKMGIGEKSLDFSSESKVARDVRFGIDVCQFLPYSLFVRLPLFVKNKQATG